MNKKIIATLLAMSLIQLGTNTIYAAESIKALPTSSSIYLDGESKMCPGYSIKGNNYFKLRDLAELLRETSSAFNISYNQEEKMIEILTGTPYSGKEELQQELGKNAEAYLVHQDILIDGVKKQLTTYTINNQTYFKLRDLSELMDCEISYNSVYGRIEITSKCTYKTKIDKASGNNVLTLGSMTDNRWAELIKHYMYEEDNKRYVIDVSDKVTISVYDANWKRVSQKELAFELPLFGGFYSGENYNYIVYGAENMNEENEKEVIRVVKYDKDFNKVSQLSVNGKDSYTTMPFNAGALRMAEENNTLVVHTARQRYLTEDGKRHQSQLTLVVNTDTMTLKNEIGRFQENHVSHSFDQYVQFDSQEHVLVDLGDAYPRAVVLQKGNGKSYKEVELFDIPGQIGANCTGVSIGGFEVSEKAYITAINTIDHKLAKGYTSFEIEGISEEQRNVVLCVLPKQQVSSSAVKQIEIMNYSGKGKTCSAPYLVKLDDKRLAVLWEEYNLENKSDVTVRYTFVDSLGNPCGEIGTMEGARLSSCRPAVVGGAISWFVDYEGERVIYTLPIE